MAIWTVGSGGNFATIAAALTSGQVNPNDTIDLRPNYSGDAATVTIENLTFNGNTTNTGIMLTLANGLAALSLSGNAPINVTGGTGGQTITGNVGDNTIVTPVSSTGLDNHFNETIVTGDGDDTVTVGGGYDIISMGAGNNDRLIVDFRATTSNIGSNGSYYFYNGSYDFYAQYDGVEHFTVFTGTGNDVLVTVSGNDVFDSGGGNDTITAGIGTLDVDGGDGTDGLAADISAYDAVNINLETGAPSSGAAEVHIRNVEYFQGSGLFTGGGNDVIVTRTDVLADVINTGGGDDTVTVGGGYDFISMGAGSNDRLIIDFRDTSNNIGSNGANYFYNGTNDFNVQFDGVEHFTIFTAGGNDILRTLGGNDVIKSGAGNDTIIAGLGTLDVDGGDGTDSVSADISAYDAVNINLETGSPSSGAAEVHIQNVEFFTMLTTGGGDDVIVTRKAVHDEIIETGGGNDTVTVGGGYDTITMGAGSNDRLIIDFRDAPGNILSDGVSYFYNGTLNFNAHYDSTVEHLTVYTAGGNDVLTTVGGDDVVNSGDGNDTINTQGGNDTITVAGDSGADSVTAGSGTDRLIANYNDQNGVTLNGNTGSFATGYDGVFNGSGANDISFTGVEHFTFTNSSTNAASNDLIVTGGGDDVIDSGGGADNVDTGAGNDQIEGGNGADTLVGGDGIDTASYTSSNAAVNVTVNGAASGGHADGDTLSGFENLVGSSFNDTLTGDSTGNLLTGGGGNDQLDGQGGSDIAVFSGNYAQYSSSVVGGAIQVTDLRGGSPDGTDLLTNFEFARFADQDVQINSAPVLSNLDASTLSTEQVPGIVDSSIPRH